MVVNTYTSTARTRCKTTFESITSTIIYFLNWRFYFCISLYAYFFLIPTTCFSYLFMSCYRTLILLFKLIFFVVTSNIFDDVRKCKKFWNNYLRLFRFSYIFDEIAIFSPFPVKLQEGYAVTALAPQQCAV